MTLQNAQGGATRRHSQPRDRDDRRQRPGGHGPVQPGRRPPLRRTRPSPLTVTRTGSTSGKEPPSATQITGDTASVDQAVTPLTRDRDVPLRPGKPLVADQAARPTANVDGNSTLTVTLKTPSTGGLALGTPNPATVTLIDDEGTVQFGAATFTASEGSGSRDDHADADRRDGQAHHRALRHRWSRGTPRPRRRLRARARRERTTGRSSTDRSPSAPARPAGRSPCRSAGTRVVETPNPETLTRAAASA